MNTRMKKLLKEISWYIIVISLGLILYRCIEQSPDSAPEGFDEKLKVAIPTQQTTFSQIKQLMNDKDADEVVYTSSWYHGSFFSPNYDQDKLIWLSSKFKQRGWQQLTIDEIKASQSEESIFYSDIEEPLNPKTVILCKNDATIVINTQDFKNKLPDSLDTRTVIQLFYTYDSPCYIR